MRRFHDRRWLLLPQAQAPSVIAANVGHAPLVISANVGHAPSVIAANVWHEIPAMTRWGVFKSITMFII